MSAKPRWSRNTVEGKIHLYSSNLALFEIAQALGKQRGRFSGFAPTALSEDVVGSEVRKPCRERVLELADVKVKTWRNAAAGWERLGMAHRCEPGVLFLFVMPQEAGSICANCSRRCPDIRDPAVPISRTFGPDIRDPRGEFPTSRPAGTIKGKGSATRSEVRGLSVQEEEGERSDLQAVEVQEPDPRRGSLKLAPLDDLQTAALIGDWQEVERLAGIRGWALVADLGRRAGLDLDAAELLRRKVGIDPRTAWWSTWWGSLSEEASNAA